MNIFVLSLNPKEAAKWHVDKHVVKMILETCQLLYSAHWAIGRPEVLGPASLSPMGLSKLQKTLIIPESMVSAPDGGYRPVHIHHPCAVWTRRTIGNYMWLCRLGIELLTEFEWRYGHKHKCEKHINWLEKNPPDKIRQFGLSPFAIAMDPIYRISTNPVECYRYFYKTSKAERGLIEYTRRNCPDWLVDSA